MSKQFIVKLFITLLFCLSFSSFIFAQALGGAGTISGTISDPNNAVVAGANVSIKNAVTGFQRTTTTDNEGVYSFNNVPPNNYQITVSANGFQNAAQNIVVRNSVPMQVPISLAISGANATVNVNADAINIENIPTTHTDV
ncbi:MAG: carboxypeptidase-like regulatory domain-containing protein, partial [Acidobacteriota bacterium]